MADRSGRRPTRPLRAVAALGAVSLAFAAAASEPNLLTGSPARNPDGSVNALIEIPAGTNAKWELAKDGSKLEWERRDGVPRVVAYLPYPGNYGMIPRTLLPEEAGGDGDPLDVIALGETVPRGAVVRVRVVGVLRLLDDGERDDKLVAVVPDGPLGDVTDLADLDARYPGVTSILETWFGSYKGPGRIETRGFAPRAEALATLDAASEAFEKAHAAAE